MFVILFSFNPPDIVCQGQTSNAFLIHSKLNPLHTHFINNITLHTYFCLEV